MNLVVGTPTNNVAIAFGYDPNDHSIIKLIVTPTGTLAAATQVNIPRNGNQSQAVQQASVVVADQQAINAQIAQGGPVGAVNIPKATVVVF
jgi:uncharacterized ubiquitin-like protein YukD